MTDTQDLSHVKLIAKRVKESGKTSVEEGYVLYSKSNYGKLSNKFLEELTFYLTKKYKGYFETLNSNIISSNVKVLSKTYISMMLFSTMLAFIFSLVIALPLVSFNIFNLVKILFIAVMVSVATFMTFYFYPSVVSGSRKAAIKNDLPFAVVHMAAVAGSGAQPIAIFNLLLGSKEYKGLEGEIKKIVNYVNLFGYDLSTSLRLVAQTTPSKDFRDLLNGMVSTIESGGSLKEYLDIKSKDLMLNYKLDRKRFVETLSTYSEVYTGVSIAAPLLFFVVLAIIDAVFGGAVFGIKASILASIGTYIGIPLMNIAFLLFLSIIQPQS